MPPTTTAPRLLYDADCRFCRAAVRRLLPALRAAGARPRPLQSAWSRERLGLRAGEIPDEMKLVSPKDEILGGVDALLWLARRAPLRAAWWAWPLRAIAVIPGGSRLLRAGYRQVALRRRCLGGSCRLRFSPPSDS